MTEYYFLLLIYTHYNSSVGAFRTFFFLSFAHIRTWICKQLLRYWRASASHAHFGAR